MTKKRTWAEFLERAKEIYGDRIEFLNEEGIEFATNNTKIKCKCKKCGNILTDRVNNILYGKNRLRCCEAYKIAFKTQDYVLKRLKETLGEEIYDFSEVEYKGANKNVKVICKKHGAFWATPNNLYKGRGCKICGIEKRANKKRKKHEKYVSDCEKVHGKNRYVYLTEYKGYYYPITFLCKKCGHVTTVQAGKHLEGSSCKFCRASKLERLILVLLQINNIEFVQEYRIGRKSLDFYLPKYNLAIECQGYQHFREKCFFHGIKTNLNIIVKRDIEKYNYCKENNINLIYFFNKSDEYKTLIYKDKFHGIYNENNVFENQDDILNYINNSLSQ